MRPARGGRLPGRGTVPARSRRKPDRTVSSPRPRAARTWPRPHEAFRTSQIEKTVALVGAGNAHLVFVKRWLMRPMPGVAVTLVNEAVFGAPRLLSVAGAALAIIGRMNPRLFLDVDPRKLHVPSSRLSGADPVKLRRQIARYGVSLQGMPAPEVYRGQDGELMIYDGVTRATRVAKLLPGQLVRIEVIDDLTTPVGQLPTVEDTLS